MTVMVVDKPKPVRQKTNRCDECGELLLHGDWPFCASPANPAGHSRGTYRWKTKFEMKTHGWTRRER